MVLMVSWEVGSCMDRQTYRQAGKQVLTQGPEGPLLGHQGEEPRLQGVGDDDVKQLLPVLPATANEKQTPDY
jgi:hypothetical protein